MDVIALKKIPFGILGIDNNGLVVRINERAGFLLSIDAESCEGKPVLQLISQERLLKKLKAQISSGFKDFTIRRVRWNKRILQIKGQVLPEGLILLIIDDTEIIKAIDKGTRSLVVGQEAERARIAKEIHDGIGPMISTIKLQIEALAKLSSNDTVKGKLDSINAMIVEAARDLRQVSHDLMPSSLKDFGLVTSIKQLIERINVNEKMKVYFHENIGAPKISKEIEINLYRVAQELLNNAIKYSQASNMHIHLGLNGRDLSMTVEDDGVGMDLTKVTSGMGMTNVQTRIKYLKGTFDIESKEGEGVLVQINIPIK